VKRKHFLDVLLDVLLPQIGKYSESMSEDKRIRKITGEYVEIIICTDNKQMRVGSKRNLLLGLASGDYISFIDDDDIVTQTYVKYLLAGMETKKDVILFDVEISINGERYKKVYYDVNFHIDSNFPNCYKRIPNHIMCWKKKIITAKFPPINRGEDAQWSKKMKDKIKSQAKIQKTLYYYNFSHQTSETQ